MKKRIDIIEAFEGIKEGDWVWCLHCERAYQVGEFREIDDLQMCPYKDCNGDTVMDAWQWEKIKEANPSYPALPQKDVLYPLYGNKQGGEKNGEDSI